MQPRYDGLASHLPDTFDKPENPAPTHRVVLVHDHPEMGHDILDVSGFHEFEPAVLDIRNILTGEFPLQFKGMMRRPKQDRKVLDRSPFVHLLFYGAADEQGLFRIRAGVNGFGDLPITAFSEEALGVFLLSLGHQGIGKRKNGLG